MQITVNGKEKSFDAPLNLYDVIVQEGVVEMMIAVARNGKHIPKGDYATINLTEGDLIEIVSPMQGG